jgi:hypothetical protein
MDAYRQALAGQALAQVSGSTVGRKPAANTMRWLVETYYGSAEFKRLDARTQRVRRLVLDRFCEADLDFGEGKGYVFEKEKLGDAHAWCRRRIEAMRRDFVADASHELKTPVAAVLASVWAGRIVGPAIAPFGIEFFFACLVYRFFLLRNPFAVGRIALVLVAPPRVLSFGVPPAIVGFPASDVCQRTRFAFVADRLALLVVILAGLFDSATRADFAE